MGSFAILEFGGQHTDLIGNRLEFLRHKATYLSSDTKAEELRAFDGFIVSGGPKSVYDRDRYPYDPGIFEFEIPALLICYGSQLMGQHFGAAIATGREYGESRIKIVKDHPLFENVPRESIVWNNHGDAVSESGDFDVIAYSDKYLIAAIAHGNKIGVQFHPELTHTAYGTQMLRNFAEIMCGTTTQRSWLSGAWRTLSHAAEKYGIVRSDMERYAKQAVDEIKDTVGKRKALVYLSGGVDSTVAYMLAITAGVDVVGIHLDMGVQRKNEAATVKKYLEEISGKKITVLDYGDQTIAAFQGLTNPEDKRKAFRDVYNRTTDDVLNSFGLTENDVVFVDGTLATDRRESGKEASRKISGDKGTVATIKTHHNVEKKHRLRTVEPLKYLSKDQARKLAEKLGIPDYVAQRKPFPGPGLSLRIVSGTYPVGDETDKRVYEIARHHGFEGCAMPIKTVGLKGDGRSFEHLALIVGDRDWESAARAQKELAEELPINRTIFLHRRWARGDFGEYENLGIAGGLKINKPNIRLVQEATEIAEKTFDEYGVKPAQLPVIAFPLSDGVGIAIRDVHTQDFRSVRPLRVPDEAPEQVFDETARKILNSPYLKDVRAVFRDVSTKPAATTEWE